MAKPSHSISTCSGISMTGNVGAIDCQICWHDVHSSQKEMQFPKLLEGSSFMIFLCQLVLKPLMRAIFEWCFFYKLLLGAFYKMTFGLKCYFVHSSPKEKLRFLWGTLRNKVKPKRLHPWSCFTVRNSAPPVALFLANLAKRLLNMIIEEKNGSTLQSGTMAPGWSHFGSTFFSVKSV